MKSSWKIHVLTLGCMLALAGPAAAAETLLAKTDLRLADASVTAELWGDRLPSGYSDNLLVLLKDVLKSPTSKRETWRAFLTLPTERRLCM